MFASIARISLMLLLGWLTLPASASQPSAPLQDNPACTALTTTDLSAVAGVGSHVLSTASQSLNGARYCVVQSRLMPAITVTILLPEEGWTGRYMQIGCGGLCGMIGMNVGAAAGCAPLTQNGVAMAATDMGHSMQEVDFGKDPQKRRDFADRAQHLAAVASKALIRQFYGKPARWSYFNGCSDGGREALIAAQRYPDDFNGIIAGAAAMNFLAQNALYHAWQARTNTGSDGRAILTADLLPVLHQSVVAQCDGLDGQKDGLIAEPQACHPDLQSIRCPAGEAGKNCLTDLQIKTVQRLYDGPRDQQSGERMTVGGPLPGSELAWIGVFVPRMADQPLMSAQASLAVLRYLAFEQTKPDFKLSDLTFDRATFDKLRALHPLYDATNPDLSAFAKAGGKLIIWHGLADPHISPLNSIAYHQAVGKQMGEAQRDSFERLYLLPGVYHCSGGEGPSLVDFMTPLMNWVEQGRAPDTVVSWQAPKDDHNGFGQPSGMQTKSGKPAGKAHGKLPPSDAMSDHPLALRIDSVPHGSAGRPVYPYPYRAAYRSGDPAQPANYQRVKIGEVPTRYPWLGEEFFTPYSAL